MQVFQQFMFTFIILNDSFVILCRIPQVLSTSSDEASNDFKSFQIFLIILELSIAPSIHCDLQCLVLVFKNSTPLRPYSEDFINVSNQCRKCEGSRINTEPPQNKKAVTHVR